MEPGVEAVTPRHGWRGDGHAAAIPGWTPASDRARQRARGLGWVSLGLGLAQLASPRWVAGLAVGGGRRTRITRDLVRATGLRELACGLGLLQRRSPGWVWARVAGDLIDLALLGQALRAPRARSGRVLGAIAVVAAATAVDLVTGVQLGRQHRPAPRMVPVAVRVITVACTPEEAYRFWRDLANLARFMPSLQSVRPLDDRRSRWTMRLPGGGTAQWVAEIVEDRPGERLAWRSLVDSQVNTAGKVRFAEAPGGRGTELQVELQYQPRWRVARTLGRLLGRGLEARLAADLRRFKQVIETGEILHSDASIHPGRHPARPAADADILTDDVAGTDGPGTETP
jgi:uncharacterized membrane protein